MKQRALAKILAGGTYEWSEIDPGQEYPSHDVIVSRAWALAGRKLKTNYPLLTEHPKYVSLIIHLVSSTIGMLIFMLSSISLLPLAGCI
jgi:hypothetical protein